MTTSKGSFSRDVDWTVRGSDSWLPERTFRRRLVGVAVLMFAASATVTLLACRSMSRAHEMAMPGWTMSMVWMRMPGETWLAGGLGFLWMWVVMMVAMMLPSLVRMLWRYSEAADGGQAVGGWRTAMMAAAYF